jgi:hypothetical protein
MLGKDGILMSSQTINGEDKQETIKIGDKDIPVINAKSQTIITNRTTGVIYKDEAEWKALGIDPKDIKVDVKIQIPSLDLLAKTK